MRYADKSSATTGSVPTRENREPSRNDPSSSIAQAGEPGRSGLALAILAAGLELGLLANGLLRVHWGVNLALWVAALAGAMLWLAHSRGRIRGDGPFVLALVAVFFAGGLAIRDTPALAVLNVGATLSALVLLGMAVLGGPSASVSVARVRDCIHAAVLLGWRTAVGGFPLLLRDASVRSIGLTPRARFALGLLRGALLAAPLLLVFGALFMAADARFNALVVKLLGFDFSTIGSHVAMILFFAWISAGYLHGVLVERAPAPIRDLDEMSIGAVEAASVLVLLDMLFAGFIAVQAQYLFGGGAVVEQTAGLTYAEYARRGFFELAFAAALVVPVLLSIDLLMRRETPRHERIFRWLAGALAVLVGLVMLSAAHRMRLYLNAYGMTEDRLYASAFMLWIALMLFWFGRTVLRGQGHRFAIGAVAAGWLVLGALNVANPDHLVARANLNRVSAGKSFDAFYASRLSGDAVPVVLEALRTVHPIALDWHSGDDYHPGVANANRCFLRDKLRDWATQNGADWRSWNLGRARARQAATANRELIEAIDCVAPDRRAQSAPAPNPAAPETPAARAPNAIPAPRPSGAVPEPAVPDGAMPRERAAPR